MYLDKITFYVGTALVGTSQALWGEQWKYINAAAIGYTDYSVPSTSVTFSFCK